MQLRGTDLRYVLTRLLEVSGPATIQQLIGGLAEWDFTVDGRPSKTVSDALRWEMGYGRVWRVGRGRYRAGDMPRSTDYRIRQRVAALREEALSLRGGHFVHRAKISTPPATARSPTADSPADTCRGAAERPDPGMSA